MTKESTENNIKFYTAIIALITVGIGLLNQLFGEKTQITITILFIAFLIFLAGKLWKYAFTKSDDKAYIKKNGKHDFCPRYKLYWLARIGLVITALLIILSVLYILIFLGKLPDCCGFLPTSTPTATLTATPSQTPKFTDITATIFTSTFTPIFTLPPIKTSTFTPSPTPTITFTPTPTPNPIIFKGFDRNCIDPNYWSWHTAPGEAAPKKYSNGCWDLSSRGLNSQEGGLRINIKNPLYPIFSVSTRLPEHNLEIRFTLDFDSFQSKSSDVAAILVFGIGPESDWVLKNGNYLTFSILQRNSTNEILEQIGTNKLKPDVRLQQFFSPKKIDVRIVINGIDMTIYLDGVTYSSVFPISLSKPNSRERFWIGYQLPANQSELKATVSEFKVVETK